MFNSNTGRIFTGWRHVYLSITADNATSWLSQSSKQRSLLPYFQQCTLHQYRHFTLLLVQCLISNLCDN